MVRPGAGRDLGQALTGLTLVAAYMSLFEALGFRAELGRAFLYVGWREGLFWLAHYSLAVPGLLLLGRGLAPALGPLAEGAIDRLTALGPRAWRALGVVFCLLLLLVAALGRRHLLLDMPITDDEHAIEFGARVLAAGQLMAPVPQPRAAMPFYFLYERDGLVTSFDFPGNLFFAALSLVTGTSSLAYALAAALSGLAVCWAGGLLAGRRGSLAAAAFWLVSPMVLSLSYTTHSQLLSRSFIALAVAFYCRLLKGPEKAALHGAGLGLFAGLAFLTRPVESACLLSPVAVHLSIAAWRRVTRRRAWWAAALAWLACALVFAWYNARVTGTWYLAPRFALPGAVGEFMSREATHHLLGTNFGFNLMLLFIWFLGPPGLVLAWLAISRRGASGDASPGVSGVALTLGAGIVLQLLVALVHPNIGIHLVGPIHYSECAVPLTLLAVLGLQAVWRRWTPLVQPRSRATVFAGLYLSSLMLFNAIHSFTLYDQARIQRLPLDAVERAGLGRAVVLAEPPFRLWDLRPDVAMVGAWSGLLPTPDPFLREEVLFLRPEVSPEVLERHFPDRQLYRMTYEPAGEPVRIRPLRASSAE